MGQQQLLLVILVTIIVGIATVVAINVFGESAANANEDAVRQDVLAIAAAAQGWYIKPEMMDGGGNSFTDISFNDFNFAADLIGGTNANTAENMNGRYVINGSTGSSMTITAYPSSSEGYNAVDNGMSTSGVALPVATVTNGGITWASN